MKPIKYESTIEFNKDLKKLCKKYRTLPEDIAMLKKAAIELYHSHGLDNNAIFAMDGYGDTTSSVSAYKVKKFASRSFKGKGVKSGLRLIYFFIPKKNLVILVEIYYKGVKAEEDKERLGRYFKVYK